jgi:hypothetical protein
MAEAATGFLHVVRVSGLIDPVHAEYRIAFAPLDGGLHGRRHVTRQGLEALTDFLRQAGVPIPEIERTWQALAGLRVHYIPRIALTPAQLEALGL